MASKNRAQKAEANAVAYDENKPIRILHYIGSLNIGGSQMMIMNVYRNIDRKKIQFDFIIDRKNEKHFAKEIESLGGRVYVFDEYFNGKNYFKFKRQWADFFKSHPEYKIIHCHVRSVASIVLKIAKKNGLKTICHSHNISNGGGLKAVFKKKLQSGILKNCDYYAACSEQAARWLYGKKTSESKECIIMHNAIDTKKFCFDAIVRKEIREMYNISPNTLLVGHVGRFVEQKNHEFIIRLADTVRDNNIMFMLCGYGPLEHELKQKVNDYGLDNKVIFISGTESMNRYYNAFDCFILPSSYEGLGIALIEAQFNGLSCIASDNVPNEADISSNVLFLPLDLSLWRKKIVDLKVRSASDKILKLSKKARQYSIDDIIPKWESFYLNIWGIAK